MDQRSPPQLAIETLGEVSRSARDDLRKVLLRSHSTFSVYRKLFHDQGITHEDLTTQDPLGILRRLPPLEGRRFYELADESVISGDEIVDMETSSGTTGTRKRRVITRRDEASETRFLAKLFEACGIAGSDRVACVDTGPLTLMVSFAKAFELLGVQEAYCYSASHDIESTVEGLARLDPTVIVTIPSILDRCLPALQRHFGAAPRSSLSKIIYVGEPLSTRTRSVLETELGVQAFAYYGASETSALGIECQQHDGIHLYTDRNIIEADVTEPVGDVREILVTTLQQEGLPLLRYALKDRVNVKNGPCPCGVRYPRVEVLGRTDGTASVMGVKFSYGAIHDAVYKGIASPGPMEVTLTNGTGEKLNVVLPERLAIEGPKIKRSLLAAEPDLAFLVAGEFLELEIAFADEARLTSSRKTQRIVDRREASNGA